jgi:hypothetical protein
MDTMQATLAAPPIRRRFDISRYAAIGYAVCSTVPVVWVGLQFDVYLSDLDEVAAHFAEPGSTTASAWSAFLLTPLAAIFLVWTLARIRTGLDRSAGGASIPGAVAALGGGLMAVAMAVSAVVGHFGREVAAGAEGRYPADPRTGVALMLLAGGLFVVEGVGAAVLVWAVALGARRARQVPGWLAWVGFVLVPLLPYAWILFMIPWLVFLVWLVAVSTMMKTDTTPAA